MNNNMLIHSILALLLLIMPAHAQEAGELPSSLETEDSPSFPMNLDDLEALTQQALEANNLSTSDETAKEEPPSKESSDQVTSPIHGWGSSLMFNLSDRRKLQDVLDALERRRRLRERQQAGDAIDEGTIIDNDNIFEDILSQVNDEIESLQGDINGETDVASLPTETTITDDGTTVIGDIDPATSITPDQSGTQTYETERGPIRAPNMFLNSILYKSPDEWLLWVNDKQVTHEQTLAVAGIEDVEIVRITPTKIIMHWHSDDLDRILPEDKGSWPNHRQLAIHEQEGIVKLILYPNQGFVGRDMSLIEGRPSMIPAPKKKQVVVPNRRRTSTAGSASSSAAGTTKSASPASTQPRAPDAEREVMNKAIRLYEGLGNHGKSNE